MKLIVLFALIGMIMCQDDIFVSDELEASVRATVEWPQNEHTVGGAVVQFAYVGLGEGSCVIDLPASVRLFHAMNAHIVPGEESNPVEGVYKVAAPAHWEAVNGTINALILYNRDDIFNITEIEFRCDPADVVDISVYSFPQNDLEGEASSNVYYRPGFHQGDVLTITLPYPVARFNFTTMDSEYEVETDGATTWTLRGFKNAPGVDEMKEVHFSINYLESDDETDSWFGASQVTVSIQNVPEDEIE